MSKVEKLSSLRNNIELDLAFSMFFDENRKYASRRLLDRVGKKFLVDDPQLHVRAIANFHDVNREASNISYNEIRDNLDEVNELIYGEAREFIRDALIRFTGRFYDDCAQNELDMRLLLSLWRFGPGASNGVKGTHFVEKIKQPMTSTVQAAYLVKQIRKYTPRIRLYDESQDVDGVIPVNGSRLVTVPKNETINRVIAIEPSGNMAMQLAAGAYLEGALRCCGLDISTQADKNKAFARAGSEDGFYATIDLRSASDLITPALIKILFPSSWHELLCSLRSKQADIDGEVVDLHMMSTMGNGFTFPMMTLILLSICYAVNRISSRHSRRNRCPMNHFGVFGDDICLPTSLYDDVCRVIQACGLSVNFDKSYCSGHFRESCGGDFHSGYDVTPFYVKSLENDPEVYVAINQVLSWSAKHKILLSRTLGFLVGLLRSRYTVPEWMDPSSGILCSEVSRRFKYLRPAPQYCSVDLDENLVLMSIAGGFVAPDKGGSAIFLPRNRVRYVVDNARLPEGFRDGRYCSFCSDGESKLRMSMVTWLLS